jgi:uncharacterized protein (TIGR03382 family)
VPRGNDATSRYVRVGAAVADARRMLRTISLSFVLLVSSVVHAADSSSSGGEPRASSSEPVVGGTAVPPHKWPDAVAVLAPTAACTGTLIAPDLVLTAGHCIETHPQIVVVDSVDYAQPGGEAIGVTAAYAYPDWQSQYDVGVLVLAHDAKTKPRPIAAACTAGKLTDGAMVEVVGFGLTTKTGTGENSRLHQAAIPVTDARCIDTPACARNVAPYGEFAAGGQGADACFGDSGGPVYLAGTVIGVVSRGLSDAGMPCGGGGIYVRADKVAGWIERTTGRKVARGSCGGAADGEGGDDAGSGGCDAAGGAGLLTLGVVLLLIFARRRRS